MTQHRINEIAADCMTAEMALSGLKGTRKPNETTEQYALRIQGYFKALHQLQQSISPIRSLPALHDTQRDNLATWQRVAIAVNRLSNEIADARKAWSTEPKMGDKARLGPKLLVVLTTLQEILDGLRDARP